MIKTKNAPYNIINGTNSIWVDDTL